MKKLVLMCALLMSFTCQADDAPGLLVNQLIGVWEGVGKQNNNSVWSIKITIRPTHYLIDYPSLNCGGVLDFIKEIDKSVMFKETLTYGTDKCISNGTTVLSIETEHHILFDWFYPEGSHGAKGNLKRQPNASTPLK